MSPESAPFRRSKENDNQYLQIYLFSIDLFIAGGVYQFNVQEIGKSSRSLALIAPILAIGLFVVLMLVTTENLSPKGKLIMGIITSTLSGILFLRLI